MTTYYNQGFDWSVADAWNTAADGSGDAHTYTVPEPANTYDLNGNTPILDMDVTVLEVVSSNAAANLQVQANRVLTANVSISAGIGVNVTSGTITINGQVTTSGTASFGVTCTITGGATINNPGGTAISVGKGTGAQIAGTGTMTIVGDVVVNATSATGVYFNSTSVSNSLTGNVTVTLGTYGVRVGGANSVTTITGNVTNNSVGYGIHVALSTATINFSGSIKSAWNINTYGAYINNGIFTWTGAATLGEGENCYVQHLLGTFTLGTIDSPWTLANSGQFCLRIQGGTFDQTYATVTAMIAAAQATAPGATTPLTIIGATFPAAGDVDSTAADFGFQGALVTPTCVLPAVEDVEDGVLYGAGGTEFEGSLPVGSCSVIKTGRR